ESYADFVRSRGRFVPEAHNALDRLLRTKRIVRSADLLAEQVPTPSARLAGARSQIIVPMIKKNELVGAIAIYLPEARPCTGEQVELVQAFAAQAVIAIENTRLLNELRESLEQQTATSEVLQVISNSPGELEPVFRALLTNAVQICDARFGLLYRIEDGVPRIIWRLGLPAALEQYLQPGPHRPSLSRAGPTTA